MSSVSQIFEVILPHLEWSDNGFSLHYVFVDAAPLAHALEDRVAAHMPVRIIRPENSHLATERAILEILQARRDAQTSLIWLDLHEGGGVAERQRERCFLSSRLNERRFLLETQVRMPMIVLWPISERSDVWLISPDLWTVRTTTFILDDAR